MFKKKNILHTSDIKDICILVSFKRILNYCNYPQYLDKQLDNNIFRENLYRLRCSNFGFFIDRKLSAPVIFSCLDLKKILVWLYLSFLVIFI